jgi:hypothetical protein
MTRKQDGALTSVIADPVVQLVIDDRVIYEEDFSEELKELDPGLRESWLQQRAGLLVDEYVDGAFDTNGELDPWEPGHEES